MVAGVLAWMAVALGGAAAARHDPAHHYFVVESSEALRPSQVLLDAYTVVGRVGTLDDFYIVKIPKAADARRLEKRENAAANHAARLGALHHVSHVSHQTPRRLHKRLPVNNGLAARAPVPATCPNLPLEFHFSDPMLHSQWHLSNCRFAGNDLNVEPVWAKGIHGQGVQVCIVDDGVDMDHPDLHDNWAANGSYDFNDHTPEPRPRLYDDRHGTRCAGEIAALPNKVCGVGVAFRARISALRILSADISEADEAAAVMYGIDVNDIYSCSWGPSDDGKTLEKPSRVVQAAFEKGIREGRGGRGVVYVFASGNGGFNQDGCNFDGYTNSRYSLTVGAIEQDNSHPPYSETCSAMLCVTYSSGRDSFIETTDVKGQCTRAHGGTSAAAPLAAGVLALVLSVRPDLTWRDVQQLVVETAQPVSLGDDDWQKTPAGRMVNHKFGYGRINAGAIVAQAANYTLLRPATNLTAAARKPALQLNGPPGTCISDAVNVTAADLARVRLGSLEHVTVRFSATASRRGALEITLISPRNIRSQLARPRAPDASADGFHNWLFMTVFHWGEPAVGRWTLQICNRGVAPVLAKLESWQMIMHGEAADSAADEPAPVVTTSGGVEAPEPTITPAPGALEPPATPLPTSLQIEVPTPSAATVEHAETQTAVNLPATGDASQATGGMGFVVFTLAAIAGLVAAVVGIIALRRAAQAVAAKGGVRPVARHWYNDLRDRARGAFGRPGAASYSMVGVAPNRDSSSQLQDPLQEAFDE